ncbi:hypothetical protein BBW68_02650 [Candidatus Erwinia dacicola]|uniref:Uncharacterized protein n=1 Tax=Candidatus Erwinia dacicola TaxID=252393 RepID=A0A1E7YVH1_9GAMM|nr:hypothetical protein BBW68_02650 [Candidatus Erwinia dacicola]
MAGSPESFRLSPVCGKPVEDHGRTILLAFIPVTPGGNHRSYQPADVSRRELRQVNHHAIVGAQTIQMAAAEAYATADSEIIVVRVFRIAVTKCQSITGTDVPAVFSGVAGEFRRPPVQSGIVSSLFMPPDLLLNVKVLITDSCSQAQMCNAVTRPAPAGFSERFKQLDPISLLWRQFLKLFAQRCQWD